MDGTDSALSISTPEGVVAERDTVARDVTDAAPLRDRSEEVTVAARSGRRMRWAVGGLVALLAIAAGVAAAMVLGAKPMPEAFRYLPADSVVVLELRPDLPGDQRQHLGNLLAHFPGFADQSALTEKLDETFARIVSNGSGGSVDYTTRIKPLLAGPMVVAIGSDGIKGLSGDRHDAGGLIVATTDGTATCDRIFGGSTLLESHRDVEIRSVQRDLSCAIDGRYLLVGDVASVRAGIDAHVDHKSVDTNAGFKAARERLATDQIGFVFLDGKALVKLIQGLAPTMAVDASIGANAPDWIIVGIRVVDDALQVELQSAPVKELKLASSVPTVPPPAKSRFAPSLPADTFAFIEAHGIGANLERALAILKLDTGQTDAVAQIEQALDAIGGIENATSWVEDLGFAAIPSGDGAGGVILIRGTDAAAVASRLTQLHNLLILASTGTDITVRDTEHDGVTITNVDLGDLKSLLSGLGVDPGIDGSGARLAFSMAARDDVLFLAVGEGVIERVLDTKSGPNLSTTASYQRVIELAGSPNNIEVYVSISGLLGFVEANLPAGIDRTTWTNEFKPYLDHLAALGETTVTTGDGARSRLVITVK